MDSWRRVRALSATLWRVQIPPEAMVQGGRFSFAQARRVGWTSRRLARAVRDDVLTLSAHGVYALVGEVVDPVEAHANAVRDAQLSSTKGWHAARRSSALLMGLPLIGQPPAVPQLSRDGGRRGGHGRDRHGRIGPLPASDTWEYNGLDMCTPARSVVDIARAESFRNGVVVADGALRRGADRADMEAVLRHMHRWPGVARARKVVRFADGRAETPGESLVRVACLIEDLPIPEPQVEIYLWGKLVGRVDGLLWEPLIAVESDGAIKFTEAGVLPDLIERQEVIRYAGIDVFRTNWNQTFKDTSVFGQRLRARIRERGTRALPPGVELRSTLVRPQPPLLCSPNDLAA